MDSRQKVGLAVVGGVIVILIFGLFFKWACHVEYRQDQITEVQWKHSTLLRQRVKKGDGDWGRPPRSGGYYREPTFEYRCRDKQDGTWCCGGRDKEGFCKMECPTYSEWCDYSYWDWPVIETKYIAGLGEEKSDFPTFGNRLNNDYRETREKHFFVTFSRQGKTWVYSTRSDEEYKKYIVGDLWEIEIPRFGSKKPKKKSYLERPEGSR